MYYFEAEGHSKIRDTSQIIGPGKCCLIHLLVSLELNLFIMKCRDLNQLYNLCSVIWDGKRVSDNTFFFFFPIW